MRERCLFLALCCGNVGFIWRGERYDDSALFKSTFIYKDRSVIGMIEKLALIVVCNKLIKQAYGVVKNDLVYDEN